MTSRASITCRMCGYAWYPNPKMWRNDLNKGRKMLKCPACAKPNLVSKPEVDKIVRNICGKRDFYAKEEG